MWYKNIKDTRPIGGCACNKLAHWPDTCFKGGWCQLAAQQEFWTSEKQAVTPRTEQAKLGRRQSADRHMSGNHLKKKHTQDTFSNLLLRFKSRAELAARSQANSRRSACHILLCLQSECCASMTAENTLQPETANIHVANGLCSVTSLVSINSQPMWG